MRVRFLFFASLFLLLFLSSGDVVLADEIDQSFTFPYNGGIAIVNASPCSPTCLIAQTFTAGLTGTLTAVGIHYYTWYPLDVQIRTVSDGVITSNVLGTASLVPQQMRLPDDRIEFPNAIAVVAGEHYAIVVVFPSGSYYHASEGAWWYAGSYPGGAFYLGINGGSSWIPREDFDQHFQTWVETNPIPEPSTLLLVGSGLAGLLLRRRKR